MKVTLFALFALLVLTASFAKEKTNIDDLDVLEKIIEGAVEKLDERTKPDGSPLYYQPRKLRPYTGWSVGFHDNGQVKELAQYKDGKQDGLWARFYDNGQKMVEANYKNGKREGLSIFWYNKGQKKGEESYKDGKLRSAEVWKPNGEKCPVTKIDKDGNGVVVVYNDEGKEILFLRAVYKNGETVN